MDGPSPSMTRILVSGKDQDIDTGGRPSEDTGRRQPCTNPGESTQRKPTLPMP